MSRWAGHKAPRYSRGTRPGTLNLPFIIRSIGYMPRLKWPAHLTPRTFYADDQLEMRRNELRRYVARAAVLISPVRCFDGHVAQGDDVAQGCHTPGFDDSDWRIIQPGERVFHAADQLVWLRATVAVPADLAGRPLALRFG